MKKSKNTIIWDFNGTILDDVETGIISVNKLLRDRGLKEIESKEEYRRVFRFPVKDYYVTLGFDFDKEPYEVVAPIWVEQYMINVKNAKTYPDVVDAIRYFKNNGYYQVILSATERNMLIGQLEGLGIADYFDEILGLDNIHANSKEEIGKAWVESHRDDNIIMIGDTDHDLCVAKAMGVRGVLICRGHQSGEYLRSLGAEVYENMEEFLKKYDYLLTT